MTPVINAEILERLGTTLLHFLWQGVVAGAGLALVRKFITRARVQYAVSLGTLLLLALCPVSTYVLLAPHAPEYLAGNPGLAGLLPVETAPGGVSLSSDNRSNEPLSAERSMWPVAHGEARGLRGAGGTASAHRLDPPAPQHQGYGTVLSEGAVCAWFAGVVLLSLYRASGWWNLRSWRRKSSAEIPAEVRAATERLRKRLRVWQRVDVLACSRAAAPVVFGVIKPVVLLPASLIAGLPAQQLEMLVAHELAHIRRWDPAVNLVQVLIETLLFYHPAVWWISRLVREDRERCADDLVMRVIPHPEVYARALASVAEGAAWPAWAPAASSGSVAERIRRILGEPARSHSRTVVPLSVLFTAGALLCSWGLWRQNAVAAGEPIRVPAGGSIQEAIDQAPPGATVKVPAGTFRENLVISKPLTLEGEGWDQSVVVAKVAVTTVSQEDLAAVEREVRSVANREEAQKIWREKLDRPALKVINTQNVKVRGLRFGAPPPTKVDGLMAAPLVLFSGARSALFEDCAVIGPFWDGIHVMEDSSVTIEKSLVAALWGTGVAVEGRRGRGDASQVILRESDVRNCYHRGVTLGAACDSSVILKCRISGSAWHGIRYDHASPTIQDSAIFANARSGIYASGRTGAKVTGNIFYGNEMGGISCWYDNNDLIEKNTFAENRREGVSVLGKSQPRIVKNIFYGHPAAVCAGAIGGDTSESVGRPVLQDNWFWKNKTNYASPKNHELLAQARTEVQELLTKYTPEHSLVKAKQAQMRELESSAWSDSAGHTENDPRFSDVSHQDFSLSPDSLAAKAGVGAPAPPVPGSPWRLTREEKQIIPDADTRDWAQWKKPNGVAPGPASRQAREEIRSGSGRFTSLTFWVPNLQSRQRELAHRITRMWGQYPEDFTQWSIGGDDRVSTLCTSNVVSYAQTNLACDITNRISQGELRWLAGIVNDLQDVPCRLPDGSEVNLGSCHQWLNDSVAAGWAVGVTLRSDRPGHRELAATRRKAP